MFAFLRAERDPSLTFPDEFDAIEVTGAPHVTDNREVGQVVESGPECVLVGLDVADNVLGLENGQVGKGHRAADRMAGKSDAVKESLSSADERLGNPVAHQQGTERRVARGQPLGRGDHVGLIPVALTAEHVADPPVSADHLVGNQQHPVAVANFPHPVEISWGRLETAAGVLDRFEKHGGHRLRALGQDGLFDGVGGVQAAVRLVLAGRAAVVIRLRDLDRPGYQRFKDCLDRLQAGDR